MPKVSVIIPSYNRAQSICEAIDSVLSQTSKDFEIIVVDDGSEDSTKEMLSRYGDKVRYFYQENKGVSAARNYGIREARGEFIAFLDSDDKWLSDKLEKQIDLFLKQPEVCLQYSYARYYDKEKNIEYLRPQHISISFEDFLYRNTVLPTSSVILRKSCFDEVGLFDENLPSIEDYDLWIRIAHKFKIGFIPSVLVEKFNYSTNLSKDKIKMYEGQIKVCQNILNRFPTEIDYSFINEKLVKQYYLLAKEQYIQGLYGKTVSNISSAVVIKLSIGRLFWSKTDNIFMKTYKIIKPYLFLSYAIAKSIQHCKIDLTQKNNLKSKIIFLAPEVLPVPPVKGGAVEAWIYEVTKMLSTSIEVFCFSIFDKTLPRYEKNTNVVHYRFKPGIITKILTCTYKLPFKNVSSSLYWLPYSFWCAWKMSNIRPDIIHIHNRIQFVPVIRFFNPKAKIILHIHQLSALTPIQIWKKNVLEKIDLFIGCSQFIADKIKTIYPHGRITYIYNGFDKKRFVPYWNKEETREKLRKQHGFKKEDRVIMYVGRIAENKGVHLLLQAFFELVNKHEKVKLFIVGAETPDDEKSKVYFEDLKNKAIRINKDKVTFTGKISFSQVNEFYLIADILVIPSIVKEGLPLVLLEAMATGIPVIVSARGGLAEIIKNGQNGLLVNDIENSEELRASISKLLDDDSLRTSLGVSGYEFVESSFLWEVIAKRMEEIYSVSYKQKNILIYESSSGFGGSANALVNIVNNLNREKFYPIAAVDNLGAQVDKITDMEVIKLTSLKVLELYSIIKRKRIGIVHINNNIMAGIPAIIASKIAGIPCVCHIRQTRKLIKREKIFTRFVNSFILINKDACAVYNQDIPINKLHVIHDGIDLYDFETNATGTFRKEYKLNGSLVVGLVGRIVKGKGHKEFILASKEVLKYYPETKFAIIGDAKGDTDEYYKEVRALVKEEGIEKNIIFTGWREDIKNIIADLDILVQATTTFPEGFGLTIAEAMAIGKPVIATNIAGPSEIVLDNKTGFLVPPGDIKAMAEKLIYFLENNNIAKDFGLQGRKRAEDLFDIKKTVSRLESIYEESLYSS